MNLSLGIVALIIGLIAVAGLAARNRPIAAPLVVGFLARSGFAFADNLYLDLSLSGDGLWWDYWAYQWAKGGLAEILSHVDTGHALFEVYMSLMYYFFGHSPLMIQVANAFLGTLLIFVVWKLARFLGAGRIGARRAAWVLALFPSTILHSGMLLREVLITLPLTLGVYQLAVWHRHRQLKNAVLATTALLVSMAFHSGAFAVIVALTAWAIGTWVRAVAVGNRRLIARNTVGMVLAIALVALTAGTGWGMDKFGRVELADLSSLSQEQDYGAKGRTSYLEGLRAETVPGLLIQSPVRVVFFLFAPFPWMVSTVRDVIGLADALLFMWLGWMLLRGRFMLRRNQTALLVIAVFAAMAVTFALGVSNYGTAFRHRNKMLPMLVAAASVVARSHSRIKVGRTLGSSRQRPLLYSSVRVSRGTR